MNESSLEEKALAAIVAWYESYKPAPNRDPDRYVVCAGLSALEAMRKKFPLERGDYVTDKNQVKTSGSMISRILARHGETRVYAREGARTTRGTVPAAESFVARINKITAIAGLTEKERADLVGHLQGWLAERAKEYFNRQTITVEVRLDKPGPHIVGDILLAARARKQSGPVAQHLVGAKLAVRYPHLAIENHSFTTADEPTKRGGDFLIGDTVFHVTVAPMPAVFDKCADNVRRGYRAILLAPDAQVQAARAMAENAGLSDKVGVLALESFVGQNVEELGEFDKAKLAKEIRTLLEKYNERVAAVETDRSLLIDIPENL
jgi:hypothetical protein